MIPGGEGGSVGLRATYADIGETVAAASRPGEGPARNLVCARRSPGMPELPEVETVRRGLQPVMEGARIERVELRRKDLRFPFPERFAERLPGRRSPGSGAAQNICCIDVDGATDSDLPSRHVRLVPHRSR